MLSINKNKIPEFLKKSELYKQFEDMVDEIIPIPKKFYPDNFTIACIENKFGKLDNDEIINVMEIFRYWMIDEFPVQVYQYMIGNIFINFKDEFYDFPIIKELQILQNHDMTNEPNSLDCTSKKVIITKSLNLFKCWLEYYQTIVKFDKRHFNMMFEYILRFGTVDQFKYLNIIHSSEYHHVHYDYYYTVAIINGNFEMLKYMHTISKYSYYDISTTYYINEINNPDKSHVLQCVKYIINNKFKINTMILRELAINSCFESIKYLYQNYEFKDDKFAHEYVFRCGILMGKLGITFAKYMIDRGTKVTMDVLEAAIGNDDVECLKYLFDNYKDDIAYNEVAFYALEHNSINCTKYIYELWFPGNIKLTNPRHFHFDILNTIAKYGNYECFKFLIDNGCKYNAYTYICIATGSGNRPLRANGESNHIDCIKYLFDIDKKKDKFKELYKCSYVKQGYYITHQTNYLGSHKETNWIRMVANIAEIHKKFDVSAYTHGIDYL